MKKMHSVNEKAKLVLGALRGEQTVSEIASENNIHPTQLSKWKTQVIERMPSLFENENSKIRKQQHVLAVKAIIDRVYTAHPEFGYRRMAIWLNTREGQHINRKAVYGHMREMGIEAIYPRQDTSKPNKKNEVYPYLLKGSSIDRPNQVWSIDITYVPIRKSWLYLTAIIDWYSRYIVNWKIDDTLEINFVLEACTEALNNCHPIIMNSDQGSHFTSPKYTSLFLNAGSSISMDHIGRAFDNIFIERFWRNIKYENIYPRCYSSPRDARIGIREYMEYYNNERPHQSLGYKTPAQIYFNLMKDSWRTDR
jgi:putative transposase